MAEASFPRKRLFPWKRLFPRKRLPPRQPCGTFPHSTPWCHHPHFAQIHALSPHLDGSISQPRKCLPIWTEASPYMDGRISQPRKRLPIWMEASPYMDGRVSQPRKRLHIWMAISPSQRRHLAQRYARVKSIQLILVRLHSQGSIPQFLSEASFSAKAYQGQSSQMLYF